MRALIPRIFLCLLCLAGAGGAAAQCPATVPAQGASLPAPLPLFPADNWWNADISAAPVDANSAGFIAFVNNGGTRKLHPDFGGEAAPGSVDIYGMPYAVVDGTQPQSRGDLRLLGRERRRRSRHRQGRPVLSHPRAGDHAERTGSRAARPPMSTSAARATGTC